MLPPLQLLPPPFAAPPLPLASTSEADWISIGMIIRSGKDILARHCLILVGQITDTLPDIMISLASLASLD